MTADSDLPPQASWPVELQKALTSYFSLDELQDLCLRLGIDFEELGEGGKSSRVIDLLRIIVANDRLDELLDRCEELRPNAGVWAGIRVAAAEDPDLFDRQLTAIDDDDNFVQLSGDFRGATITIESGLFGGFFRKARNRRITLALVIALAVLTTGGVLYSMGLFEPEPIPDTMTGIANAADFNIAVAEFAVLDENGNLTNDSHTGGLRIAERIARNLRQEFADPTEVAVWNDSPELLAEHHVTIGVVADEVDGARLPEEVTEALDADVVIYGVVEPTSGQASQTLNFYLAPQFDQDFTNLVGDYVFDAIIPVGDPTHPTEETWVVLDPLSKSLAWLLRGLRQEKLGLPEQALTSFERAASFTSDEDIIQFFIGQENLFLAQKTQGQTSLDFESAAETAFAESQRLNPGNARAIIGLGGVQTVRAQRLLNTGKAPEFDGDPVAQFNVAQTEARRALATYSPVAEQDEQIETYGLPVRSIARLGQGIALRVLGDAAFRAGDPEASREAIGRAIETLESAVAPLEEAHDYRLMAQLYQALGTVYQWQGFLDEQAASPNAADAYDRALQYYGDCAELGTRFATDRYLREEIVGKLCLPYIETLQQTIGGE